MADVLLRNPEASMSEVRSGMSCLGAPQRSVFIKIHSGSQVGEGFPRAFMQLRCYLLVGEVSSIAY